MPLSEKTWIRTSVASVAVCAVFIVGLVWSVAQERNAIILSVSSSRVEALAAAESARSEALNSSNLARIEASNANVAATARISNAEMAVANLAQQVDHMDKQGTTRGQPFIAIIENLKTEVNVIRSKQDRAEANMEWVVKSLDQMQRDRGLRPPDR